MQINQQPKRWLLISPDGRNWADPDPTVLAEVLAPSSRARSSQVQLAPSRFVTITLASTLTGFTPGAIRAKIASGVWLEGRQYVRREGRVLIDLQGYETWAQHGR